MAKTREKVKAYINTNIKEPSKYNVVMYNDDVTTMEFVVEVLCRVFAYSTETAMSLMLQIHNSGKAIVGVYSYDIAATKVDIVTDMAVKAGYPLRVTCEKA